MKVNVPISYKYWHRNKERNQCQQTVTRRDLALIWKNKKKEKKKRKKNGS